MGRGEGTFSYRIRVLHSNGGGKARKAGPSRPKEVAKSVAYGRDISKCVHEVNGGGTKEPADLAAALILGDLQHLDKGFLFSVSKPDL